MSYKHTPRKSSYPCLVGSQCPSLYVAWLIPMCHFPAMPIKHNNIVKLLYGFWIMCRKSLHIVVCVRCACIMQYYACTVPDTYPLGFNASAIVISSSGIPPVCQGGLITRKILSAIPERTATRPVWYAALCVWQMTMCMHYHTLYIFQAKTIRKYTVRSTNNWTVTVTKFSQYCAYNNKTSIRHNRTSVNLRLVKFLRWYSTCLVCRPNHLRSIG